MKDSQAAGRCLKKNKKCLITFFELGYRVGVERPPPLQSLFDKNSPAGIGLTTWRVFLRVARRKFILKDRWIEMKLEWNQTSNFMQMLVRIDIYRDSLHLKSYMLDLQRYPDNN